jgi:hypothetical protein
MQAALQKHPKFNNPAYPEGKKYDKALQARYTAKSDFHD